MALRYPIRTRYSETGQDGIIHHSSYPIYFEVARVEFFREVGCDINALEREKILCPVVELSVQYLKPLYSSEDIEVAIAVSSVGRVRFCLSYEIYRSAMLVAKGSTSHCFIDARFKPIALFAPLASQLRARLH